MAVEFHDRRDGTVGATQGSGRINSNRDYQNPDYKQVTTHILYPGGGVNHVTHIGTDAGAQGVAAAAESIRGGVKGLKEHEGKTVMGGYEQFGSNHEGQNVRLGGGLIHLLADGTGKEARKTHVEHKGHAFDRSMIRGHERP